MVTRLTASAFLSCNNSVLMLKRGLHKALAPGSWAGIGGHMELSEITDPRALDLVETCYREVQEETRINRTDIKNLRLRYIAVRKVDNEIMIHHHFMGDVETKIPLPACEEGELHWINKKDICNLQMGVTVGQAVKHWLENPESDNIYMVAVNKTGDGATISEL